MPAPSWRRAWRSHVWLVYLCLGLIAILVYGQFPTTGGPRAVRLVIYLCLSASAAGAVFLGLRRQELADRRPWLLIGISQVMYAIGDGAFYIFHYVLDITEYPALPDVLYLGHYPLFVVGLVLLTRRRTQERDIAGLLDGSMFLLAAVLLSWLYLIAPQVRADHDLFVGVTSVAYPAMDLALLGVAIRLVLGHGSRPPAFFLLAGNLLANLTADTIYVVQQTNGTFEVGNYLDAIWLTGNLALGAAGLHPTMVDLTRPASPRAQARSGRRLVALSSAGLVAPTVLAVQVIRGDLRDLLVAVAVSAIMMILIIVRMAGLEADQRRLAITDGLTGLRTRRYLETEMRLAAGRVRRTGSGMGLILVDVDHFKSVNDRFGHPAGDQVLTEVARRLLVVTRPGDVVARYGGEEFALLTLNVRGDALADIAERLRRGVGREPVRIVLPAPRVPDPPARTGESGAAGSAEPTRARGQARSGAGVRGDTGEESLLIAVTVSVGAAALPDHADDTFALVAAADRALYAAKAAGRDRVAVGSARPGHDVGGHDVGGHDVGGHDVGGHDVGGHDVGGHDVGGHDVGGHDVGERVGSSRQPPAPDAVSAVVSRRTRW
ncbi:diguanylate cyclase (GGDEF) domain-containing protein [Frankia sp. Allo2]|nr:GGDEF domain-containing protein [Frankia sp. Allo2]KFB04249.1 diguanylate cyclase (GGDEF) domain-containing protein [Frankia sp. Allo2]